MSIVLTIVVTVFRAVIGGMNFMVTLVGCWFGLLYGSVSFDLMRHLSVSHELAISTAFLVGATGFFERQHVQHTAEKARKNAEHGLNNIEAMTERLVQRVFKDGQLVINHYHHPAELPPGDEEKSVS